MGDSDFEAPSDSEHRAGRPMVANQAHDEEFVVDDESSPEPSPAARRGPVHAQPPRDGPAGGRVPQMQQQQRFAANAPGHEEEESSDDDYLEKGVSAAGVYNPADFAHLNVPPDVQEVFALIGRFKPAQLPIEPRLKPFIPDYIPAIGDIDEMIKVPRPDGKPDFLGLKVLDEPAARQSDRSVLLMQLRNASGAPSVAAEQVASIEQAERNKHSLSEWVKQAAAMAASRPPETVSYTAGPMPELEDLMEQWPPEMEAALEHVQLTRKTLDTVDIKALVRIYCALLDIPVYGDNLVEPLHQMLSLCLELKLNPYLSQRGGASAGDPFRKTPSPGAFRVPGSADQYSRPGSEEAGGRGGGNSWGGGAGGRPAYGW